MVKVKPEEALKSRTEFPLWNRTFQGRLEREDFPPVFQAKMTSRSAHFQFYLSQRNAWFQVKQ